MLILSILYLLFDKSVKNRTSHSMPNNIYPVISKPRIDNSIYNQNKYDYDCMKYGTAYANSMKRLGEYSKEGRFSKC